MSATDELRRMLDERGVEYEVRVENITDIEHIIWHPNKFSQWDWNEEFGVGWLNGWQSGVTPEQAIAATLGGECEWKLKEKWPNRDGDDHIYGYETSCGARHTWWPDSLPSFCPTCGSKVKAVGE